MKLPDDANGYAIDTANRTVHRRYASHAVGLQRTRSRDGVHNAVGNEFKVCRECFPAPVRKPRARCTS